MNSIKHYLLLLIKGLKAFSSISVRLTKITGKSKYPIHPKHLLKQNLWFLSYLSNKDKILDIGCGNGQNLLACACHVKHATGIDKNPIQLKIAINDSINRNLVNTNFLSTDLEKILPFLKESFDKVMFLDTLEHLNNRHLALSEAVRVLKQNGILFLSVPNKNTSWKVLQRKYGINSVTDPDHKIEYNKQEIMQLCKKFNLRVEAFLPIVYDTPLAPLIDLIGGVNLDLYRWLTHWKEVMVNKRPEETIGFRVIARKV